MFADLHPAFQPWATWIYDVAQYYGLRPRVTSTFRSVAQQAALYERYRLGRHPYPVAPPGRSQHNYGLAIDMVTADNPRLGAVWNLYGRRWGGGHDPIHFGA